MFWDDPTNASIAEYDDPNDGDFHLPLEEEEEEPITTNCEMIMTTNDDIIPQNGQQLPPFTNLMYQYIPFNPLPIQNNEESSIKRQKLTITNGGGGVKRKRRCYTEEEKEERRQQREKNKIEVVQLREMLNVMIEQQAKEKMDLQKRQEEFMFIHSNINSKDENGSHFLTQLTQNVLNSQNLIHCLNNEIIQLGIKYRVDLCEADSQKNALLTQINSLQMKECEYKDMILNMNKTIIQYKEKIDELQHKLDNYLPPPSPPVLTQSITSHLSSSQNRTLMSKQSTSMLIKDENNTNTITDNSLYKWNDIMNNPTKCIELYGFTPEQMIQLEDLTKKGSKERSKKGAKPTITNEDMFLAFLYLFIRYPTIRVLSDRFKCSGSVIQSKVMDIIQNCAESLFKSSQNANTTKTSEGQRLCYTQFFIETNRPKSDSTALEYYSKEYDKHGVYVHCIHDERNTIVKMFTIRKNGVKPRDWCDESKFPLNKDIHVEFQKRMTNKFLLRSSKYRGELTDLPNVVQCLLALVNFDITYQNEIKESDNVTEIKEEV